MWRFYTPTHTDHTSGPHRHSAMATRQLTIYSKIVSTWSWNVVIRKYLSLDKQNIAIACHNGKHRPKKSGNKRRQKRLKARCFKRQGSKPTTTTTLLPRHNYSSNCSCHLPNLGFYEKPHTPNWDRRGTSQTTHKYRLTTAIQNNCHSRSSI